MTSNQESQRRETGEHQSIFGARGPGRSDHFISGWYGQYTTEFIAESFNDAAKVLLQNRRVVSYHGDRVLWPMGFLHRQAIELVMKELTVRLRLLLASPESSPPKGHDLHKLWKDLKQLLINYDGGKCAGYEWVENVVQELHDVDPRGDAFRYATPIGGSQARSSDLHLSDLQHVDVEHFSQSCDQAFRVLRGTLDGVNSAVHSMEENFG